MLNTQDWAVNYRAWLQVCNHAQEEAQRNRAAALAESFDHRLCIACKDKKTGKTGDFIFLASEPLVAVSPVFPDAGALGIWMRENGFESYTYPYWNGVRRAVLPEIA